MAAVDWFGATAAVTAPARPARPRSRPTPAPRTPAPAPRTSGGRTARRRASGRRLTGGILWISTFAVLLTGIVALNVAVLRTNMKVNNLDKQEIQLRAENAALASQVSSAASARLIEATARKLGLVPAPATDTSYLDLTRR